MGELFFMIFIKILCRNVCTKTESSLNHLAYNTATVCTPEQFRTEAYPVEKENIDHLP